MVAAALIRFPADDFRLELRFLFEIAVVAGLCVYLWRINPWWALFLGLALSSRTFSYDRHSYMAFEAVLYGSVWFLVLVQSVSRKHISYLLDGICVIALINAAYMGIQLLDMDFLFVPAPGVIGDPEVGLMGNINFVSALLAFSAPAFLRPGWKWGLILIVAGICVARTSLGAISLSAGALFYFIMKGRLYPSLALAIFGSSAYILFVDAPGFERIEVWRNGLEAWALYPLGGYGIGHWKSFFDHPMVTRTVWTTAHNEFVQMLFELGAGFAVVVTGYLWHMAARIKKFVRVHARIPGQIPFAPAAGGVVRAATALIIIAVNSFANLPFHIATTAMVAVAWMAILEIELRGERT